VSATAAAAAAAAAVEIKDAPHLAMRLIA